MGAWVVGISLEGVLLRGEGGVQGGPDLAVGGDVLAGVLGGLVDWILGWVCGRFLSGGVVGMVEMVQL